MSVRAKFICVSKEHDTNEPDHGTVVLEAVISGSEENKDFFRYTPWGHVKTSILNPSAFAYFEPGKEYYLDFTVAD